MAAQETTLALYSSVGRWRYAFGLGYRQTAPTRGSPDEPFQLLEDINIVSEEISERILSWVNEKEIDMLLSENASALPSHLSMALGIWKAVESSGLPTLTHDHDFHWERGDRYISPHDEINKLILSP